MRLLKLHGLGNDFLVLLDFDDSEPVDGETARAMCNREQGIGADGFIRVTALRPHADVTMELFNADGSRAETSGNGLRCVARAVVDAGFVTGDTLTIATDAGVRRVTLNPAGDITVEMGPALVKDVSEPARRMAFVDMGNPHLVLAMRTLDGVALEQAGRRFERLNPGGLNVEVVEPGPGVDELTMRVWERGVGETLACGSGACAAAIALRDLKEVGDRVTVHQPGGDVLVELSDGAVSLTGPAELVAMVEVPWL